MFDVSKLGGPLGAALLLGAVAMPLSAMAAGTATGMPQGMAATTQTAPAMHQHADKAAWHNEVTAAQTALNKNGASLKVDGKMGPKTKAALAEPSRPSRTLKPAAISTRRPRRRSKCEPYPRFVRIRSPD